MPKEKSIEPPQWKRLFFKGIPIASRYRYLGVELPEEAALERYYDWQEGDFPQPDDIVQWLLLLEYVFYTTNGNIFFQKCCAAAPACIQKALGPYILRRLYPGIVWKEPLPDEEIERLMPFRQEIVLFGGAPFFSKDVLFMTDSTRRWPLAESSGAFPVDMGKSLGKSEFLPVGFHYRKSLRTAIRGERGPTIISRNIQKEQRERFEEMLREKLAEKTDATMRERIIEEVVESTMVENEGGKALLSSPALPGVEMPMERLPDKDESVFLVSGMTHGILGRGGMGMVYKILVKELEVFHALKILHPPEIIRDTLEWLEFRRRFLREAKILANLHHTHIAQIHGFGEWKNYPYIEMEFVDGSDIKSILSAGGPVDPAAATAIAIQVARALSHAHNRRYVLDGKERCGLIHRDIKPQNIMVSNEGESKLLDFGVAVPASGITGTVAASNFVGTLQYASPEQIAGGEIDLRTDIHSFGQVFYEMVAGRPPYEASNIQQLIGMKLNNNFIDPSKIPARIPKTLRHIIKTCLQRDPDRRFRTSDDLLSVLEEAHHELTTENPDAVVRDYMTGRKIRTGQRLFGNEKRSVWRMLFGR